MGKEFFQAYLLRWDLCLHTSLLSCWGWVTHILVVLISWTLLRDGTRLSGPHLTSSNHSSVLSGNHVAIHHTTRALQHSPKRQLWNGTRTKLQYKLGRSEGDEMK